MLAAQTLHVPNSVSHSHNNNNSVSVWLTHTQCDSSAVFYIYIYSGSFKYIFKQVCVGMSSECIWTVVA
jgi:hypothetical protein